MPDVFVSYKRENGAKVAKLVAALEAQGLDVWWDREIAPGAPWEATIERQLRDAKAVIVCWSEAAVESENVRSEARLARRQGRLIQAFLEPCEPPLFFGERQGADLTNWRGKADDPRILKLAEAARAVGEGKTPTRFAASPKARSIMTRRAMLLAALTLLLAVSVSWYVLRIAAPTGPTTLAVLPFRSLSPADANLSDAIADDTRSAIGQNPNLRVLGRLAVTALAQQGLTPQEFRKKVGADYLLDGSVQRDGQLLRIKVSLVRAKDAAEVWADQLDGKVDDVFAFQSRIAHEVEGRIRGRLAPNHGIKAENITTSGEVYAIFADARAHNRKRNPDDLRQGITLLETALAKDPNFAPAWAELGIATSLPGARLNKPADVVREEAAGYVRRALQLAPNLAVAHAALSMVQNHPAELEPELRKAVALDPNDAQAWNWLGTMLSSVNRYDEGTKAFERAHEIEPLWTAPIGNLMQAYGTIGDTRRMSDLLETVQNTGDEVLMAKARFFEAVARGRIGEAITIGVKLANEHPSERAFIVPRMAEHLIQLGFIEQGVRGEGWDPAVVSDLRGTPPSAADILAGVKKPIEIWDSFGPLLMARSLPKNGRLKEFVGYYKAAFKSPQDFYNLSPSANKGYFRSYAPNVAVLLREANDAAEATAILRLHEALIAKFLANGPQHDYFVELGQLRAAQGRDNDAVRFLGKAVDAGWLPDRLFTAVDVADEPCFAQLVQRADFQALRKRLLLRIEQERRIASPAVASYDW